MNHWYHYIQARKNSWRNWAVEKRKKNSLGEAVFYLKKHRWRVCLCNGDVAVHTARSTTNSNASYGWFLWLHTDYVRHNSSVPLRYRVSFIHAWNKSVWTQAVLCNSQLDCCTAQVQHRTAPENLLLLSWEQLRLIVTVHRCCCRLFLSSRNAKQLAAHLML